MAYFGVDTVVRVEELNHQFRNILRQKGQTGIPALKGIFEKHDFNKNGKLDLKEFEEALATFG